MTAGIVVKIGNFGFDLTFTIVNADGSPRNLTSNVVTLYVYTQEQNPVLLFSGPCPVNVNPLTGIVTYNVISTDLSQLGTFDAELEMTIGSSFLLDTETFTFNIITRHPTP